VRGSHANGRGAPAWGVAGPRRPVEGRWVLERGWWWGLRWIPIAAIGTGWR